LAQLVQDTTARLITILGGGGIGKTRLALEIIGDLADQFKSIYFVPLAQLATSGEILPAIADKAGIQAPPGLGLKQTLFERLYAEQALVVLDNFEHLLDGALLVDELLCAGEGIKVLTTSRERLNLEAEIIFRLGGLDLSDEVVSGTPAPSEAVQLFTQKARHVRVDFNPTEADLEAIKHICRMLDGNPLAILLAAAWVEHFSPGEIAGEVQHNLDFLSRTVRDADPRHASIRAVFESSYDQLNDLQKSVFRKLACFRGGFDLAAAREIAGADLSILIDLVDRSMLRREPASGRYDLHELLRQYAGEALEAAGEGAAIRERHARYYLAFVHQQEPVMISPGQNEALDKIQADFDNIRQAFTWAIENRQFQPIREALPGAYAFCDQRSRFYEGVAIFLDCCKGMAPRRDEPLDPGRALALLSWYDMRSYHEPFTSYDEVKAMTQACLERANSFGDVRAQAASLILLGAIEEDRQDFPSAIRKYEQAMDIDPGLDDAYWVVMRIGLCHRDAGQYPEAVRAFESCLQRSLETGEKVKSGWSLVNLGDTRLAQGKTAEALEDLDRSCQYFQQVNTRFGIMWANFTMARAYIKKNDLENARTHAEAAFQLSQDVRSQTWMAKTEALLNELNPQTQGRAKTDSRLGPDELSAREMEILQLLKSELSGPEIASRLVISLNTFRFHTKNIYQKLGVNNRLEALRRAKELEI
jgi:predicted ATPase/DNA-binding CsgD family transcriptional regulator